ncbi:MAG: peptidogalycan biosysnthesis protein, partial [Pseudomonadota bacterium]
MTGSRPLDNCTSSDGNVTEFRIRIVNSFEDIDRDGWSSLSGTTRPGESGGLYNPFVSYAFLNALEAGGCATADTGWLGQHLLLETDDGSLLGALPCYLKNHSQGEYVFDHGWADAYERAGGRYYPKLQSSIPFTPATGPRLLHRRDAGNAYVQSALAAGLKTLTDRIGASSAHATFVPEDEIAAFADQGYLQRTD